MTFFLNLGRKITYMYIVECSPGLILPCLKHILLGANLRLKYLVGDSPGQRSTLTQLSPGQRSTLTPLSPGQRSTLTQISPGQRSPLSRTALSLTPPWPAL